MSKHVETCGKWADLVSNLRMIDPGPANYVSHSSNQSRSHVGLCVEPAKLCRVCVEREDVVPNLCPMLCRSCADVVSSARMLCRRSAKIVSNAKMLCRMCAASVCRTRGCCVELVSSLCRTRGCCVEVVSTLPSVTSLWNLRAETENCCVEPVPKHKGGEERRGGGEGGGGRRETMRRRRREEKKAKEGGWARGGGDGDVQHSRIKPIHSRPKRHVR